jgi:hypothetical protein
MTPELDQALRWDERWPHILETLRSLASSNEAATFTTVLSSLMEQLREHGGAIVGSTDALTAVCPQPISLAGGWHSSATSASLALASRFVTCVWRAVRPLDCAEALLDDSIRFSPQEDIDAETWPACRDAVAKFFEQFESGELERLAVLVECERVAMARNGIQPQPETASPAPQPVEMRTEATAANTLETGPTREEQAIALIVSDHSLSVFQVAERLGVDRKTPYRWTKFMGIFNGLSQSSAGTVRRGERDAETGDVLAYDNDDPAELFDE